MNKRIYTWNAFEFYKGKKVLGLEKKKRKILQTKDYYIIYIAYLILCMIVWDASCFVQRIIFLELSYNSSRSIWSYVSPLRFRASHHLSPPKYVHTHFSPATFCLLAMLIMYVVYGKIHNRRSSSCFHIILVLMKGRSQKCLQNSFASEGKTNFSNWKPKGINICSCKRDFIKCGKVLGDSPKFILNFDYVFKKFSMSSCIIKYN